MSHYINKIIENYCKNCNTITDMEIVSLGSKLNINWLRCKECYGATMIREEELEKKAIRNKNNKLISAINNNQNEKQIKKYNPSETYKLGQTIYHSGFKDKGIVTKIKPGSGEFGKIIVKFDNVGQKLLIQGVSTDKSK